MTDKYGNDVTQLARPLPVEYLLVDLPAAFPVDLAFTFYADPNIRSFEMAHRSDIGEIQVCCLEHRMQYNINGVTKCCTVLCVPWKSLNVVH